ncbi:MAG TPA: hypothetical protein VGM93_09525, partial [Acidimicrobiales bacterium]
MTSAPLTHLPSPISIRDLAATLDAAFIDLEPGEPAQIVRVIERPGDPVEIGLLPVPPGEHPADLLLGFTAPPEWAAVGIVAIGRASRASRGSRAGAQAGAGDPGPEARPVRLTYLAPRYGEPTSLTSPIGAPGRPVPGSGAPEGWLADVLCRVLDRPTPAPGEGPTRWLESRWLDALLEASAGAPARRWSWSLVADLHPLSEPGPTPSPATLRLRMSRFAAQAGWPAIRRAVAGLDVAEIARRQALPP